MLNEILGQKLANRAQGQRLMERYGGGTAVKETLVIPLKKSELSLGVMRPKMETPEVIYAMFDGVMLPLDGGYEETKIGRVFRASQVSATAEDKGKNEQQHRAKVFNSEYIAQRGYYTNFTEPFGELVAAQCKAYPQAQLVMITDGAGWMRDWAARTFPNCTHILDFFHAYEHLCEFAIVAITDRFQREVKLSSWKKMLRHGEAVIILKEVKAYQQSGRPAVANKANELVTYLTNNLDRMKYDEYRSRGLLIGSGAIESAARSIVQQRCKLSGQRWSEKGSLQAALNIRSLYKSGKRSRMEKIINDEYRLSA